jgi:hypothetical protein
MSLHGLQCALAELFLDPASRERYARDPRAFAQRFELNERDRTQLEALSANAVASYAATLGRKRRGEAAKLLPNSYAVLGAEFTKAFEGWSKRARLPDGRLRYLRDALGFCRYLLAECGLSPEERVVVARERRSLQPRGWALFARW